MKGRNGLRTGLIAAAAIVLALGAGLLVASQASAQQQAVSISRVTVAPGEQTTVNLTALDISAPGLGAWEIGITYDPRVVSAVTCSPQAGSVCNVNFASNQVRVVGASASGLRGDTTLARVTFRCEREGASALTLGLDEFADATTGSPRPIAADVESGSVACAAAAGVGLRPPAERPTEEEGAALTATAGPAVTGLPTTGTGGSSGGGALGWLTALLAGVGLAGIAGFAALRLRPRRP